MTTNALNVEWDKIDFAYARKALMKAEVPNPISFRQVSDPKSWNINPEYWTIAGASAEERRPLQTYPIEGGIMWDELKK